MNAISLNPLLTIVSGSFFLLALTIYFIECAAFFFGFGWYYRLGPALHHEEWQSSASVEDARAAIHQNLQRCDLARFDWGDAFGFRRQWWKFGAYPRALLQVKPSERGAVLVYEVRPFVSMALFCLAMVTLILAPLFRHQSYYILTCVAIVVIAAMYVGYWWREIRIFNRLGGLRLALAEIGVLVCGQCGYDLHGRDPREPCPECGITPIPLASPV